MVVACSPARTARARSRSSTATNFATKFACEVKSWDAQQVVRQARAQAPRSLPAVRRRRRDDGGGGRGPRHEGARRAGASLGRVHRRGPRRRADDRGHVRGVARRRARATGSRRTSSPTSSSTRRRAWSRSAPARPAPNISHVSACSTGAHSIGEALRAIRHGYADGMICRRRRGDDLDPRRRRLQRDARDVDAQRRAREGEPPVRQGPRRLRDRRGRRHPRARGARDAKKRGARIYAELTGYGANSDAHHIAAPAPEHRGAQACFRVALDDAKLDAERRSATSTRTAPRPSSTTRTRRSRSKVVFGDHAKKLAMSSTKSMTGHTLGAAGGIEAGDHRARDRARRAAADHQLRDARSRLRPRLRAEQGARAARRARDVEQLRLRRHQRGARS